MIKRNSGGQKLINDLNKKQIFSEIINAMPDAMVVINNHGVIVNANCLAGKLFGSLKEGLLGRYFINLLTLESRHQFRYYWQNILLKKTYFKATLSVFLTSYSKKKQTQVELAYSCYYGEQEHKILLVLRDLTAYKNTFSFLQKREIRYRDFVESPQKDYFFFLCDGYGHYIYISPSVSRVLGYSPEQFRLNSYRYLSNNPINGPLRRCRQTLPNRSSRRYLCEYLHADGSLRIFDVLETIKVNALGSIEKVKGIAKDITEHKKTVSSIEQKYQQAEKTNQAKSRFISHISHELRTPLNGVLAYTQKLLREPHLDEDQYRCLESIDLCGKHLLGIINPVLDYSQLENQEPNLCKTSINLLGFLHEVEKILQESARKKSLALILELDKALPDWIVIDSIKLKQVLINLIANGIKFTHKGYVKIRVSKQKDLIRFMVEDTGAGLCSEQMKKIFQPFERLEENKATEGTGLGLAISQHLIEAMGGVIKVKSELGKGCRFYFSLALELYCDSRYEEDQKPNDSADDPHEKHLLIYIEANKLHYPWPFELEANGYKVHWAKNLALALDKLGSNHLDFLLIDTQINLKKINQLVEKICSLGQEKRIRILGVRSSVDSNTSLTYGGYFDDFIHEPYDSSRFLSKAVSCLGTCSDSALAFDANLLGYVVSALPVDLSKMIQHKLKDALEIGDITAIENLIGRLKDKVGTETLCEFLQKCCLTCEIEHLECLLELF